MGMRAPPCIKNDARGEFSCTIETLQQSTGSIVMTENSGNVSVICGADISRDTHAAFFVELQSGVAPLFALLRLPCETPLEV